MSLFTNLKRFEVKNLFVCKIFTADNLEREPIPYRISAYHTKWIEHFHGVKILYCTDSVFDHTLVDPIYGIQYIPESALGGFFSDRNQYYKKIGNIIDIFGEDTIGKKRKTALNKIKELNSTLEKKYL